MLTQTQMSHRCALCNLDGHADDSVCPVSIARRRHRTILENIRSKPADEGIILLSREINSSNIDMYMSLETCKLASNNYRKSLDDFMILLQDDLTDENMRKRERLCVIRRSRKQYVHHTSIMFEIRCELYDQLLNLLSEYPGGSLEMADLANGFIVRPLKHSSDYIKELIVVFDETPLPGSKCECPICYESIFCVEAIARKECGHKHCLDCFTEYLSSIKDTTSKPTCSLCRQDIDCVVAWDFELVSKLNQFKEDL